MLSISEINNLPSAQLPSQLSTSIDAALAGENLFFTEHMLASSLNPNARAAAGNFAESEHVDVDQRLESSIKLAQRLLQEASVLQ